MAACFQTSTPWWDVGRPGRRSGRALTGSIPMTPCACSFQTAPNVYVSLPLQKRSPWEDHALLAINYEASQLLFTQALDKKTPQTQIIRHEQAASGAASNRGWPRHSPTQGFHLGAHRGFRAGNESSRRWKPENLQVLPVRHAPDGSAGRPTSLEITGAGAFGL